MPRKIGPAGAGVPGPAQDTTAPGGPIDQSTRATLATAVTVVAPAVAVVDTGPVVRGDRSTHIHTGNPTAAFGFADTCGVAAVRFSWLIANWATTTGDGGGGGAGAGATGAPGAAGAVGAPGVGHAAAVPSPHSAFAEAFRKLVGSGTALPPSRFVHVDPAPLLQNALPYPSKAGPSKAGPAEAVGPLAVAEPSPPPEPAGDDEFAPLPPEPAGDAESPPEPPPPLESGEEPTGDPADVAVTVMNPFAPPPPTTWRCASDRGRLPSVAARHRSRLLLSTAPRCGR